MGYRIFRRINGPNFQIFGASVLCSESTEIEVMISFGNFERVESVNRKMTRNQL